MELLSLLYMGYDLILAPARVGRTRSYDDPAIEGPNFKGGREGPPDSMPNSRFLGSFVL